MIEHGTPGGYRQCKINNGKRCAECREAWNRYYRELRAKKRANEPKLTKKKKPKSKEKRVLTHGDAMYYQACKRKNNGIACKSCLSAWSEYMTEWRSKTRDYTLTINDPIQKQYEGEVTINSLDKKEYYEEQEIQMKLLYPIKRVD